MADSLLEKPTGTYDGLTRFTVGVYGVGHILNDLCAACWFNYLLYFLTDVMQINSAGAG
jgi:Na+/melibiose symporter-like transporter